jgi:Adenylate and Guanylate cyclase catalytic domain
VTDELGRPPTGGAASTWLHAVRSAERRGELLAGYDLAMRGLDEFPGDTDLRYRAVLALARTGSTEQARRQFDALDLAAVETEDVAALAARIAKDQALEATGPIRRRLAAEAAAQYEAVFSHTGGYYPAINAATLRLVAGDPGGSRELARRALDAIRAVGDHTYFAAATEAEAHLLLGRPDRATEALHRAAGLHGGDLGALSSTRRQLRLVCDLTAADLSTLGVLAGPSVAHFCGHRIDRAAESGRFPAAYEPALADAMHALLGERPVGAAYGALAGGADILWAEAVLAHGGELHVVLPFDKQEFHDISVAPCGPGWSDRFRSCLAAATSVTLLTEDAFLGDDVLFRYGSDVSMGLALLRARFLDAEAWQLAVWDGETPERAAGTAADVATWCAAGHRSFVLRTDGSSASPSDPPPAPPARDDGSHGRVVRALLFGDVKGFSKLHDGQLLSFRDAILQAFADELAVFRDEVEFANTWGDALFAVVDSAPTAARLALAIQERIARLDLTAAGLPEHLALRMSAHLGPVFPVHDPVLGSRAFMGAQVSRAARIEPVTVPGAVFVTEAFAAALELAGENDVRCDYVGHMPTAKDYGRLRMYRLRRPTPRT